MTNVVVKFTGVSASIVIIAGHYDTERMTTPFVDANDGGSSAAFLLEMARVLARRVTTSRTGWYFSTGKRLSSIGPARMVCTVAGTLHSCFQLKEC
jgi:Zn-dependent M28 family amino/carboxypeptidase